MGGWEGPWTSSAGGGVADGTGLCLVRTTGGRRGRENSVNRSLDTHKQSERGTPPRPTNYVTGVLPESGNLRGCGLDAMQRAILREKRVPARRSEIVSCPRTPEGSGTVAALLHARVHAGRGAGQWPRGRQTQRAEGTAAQRSRSGDPRASGG